ncbi:MAG: hypothetical protein WCF79_17785, partial [Rhodomicrobium sp.]
SQYGMRKMKRNNLEGVLTVAHTAGTSSGAISLHPSSREGHLPPEAAETSPCVQFAFARRREAPSKLVGFPVRHPGSRDVLQPPQDVDGFFGVALARPVARKFLFFRAEPTKKLPELPELPEAEAIQPKMV